MHASRISICKREAHGVVRVFYCHHIVRVWLNKCGKGLESFSYTTKKVYLKDKVEGLRAAGSTLIEAALTEAITERKTVDINELRAYTSLQDWLQDNGPT